MKMTLVIAALAAMVANAGEIRALVPCPADAEWTKSWWMPRHEEKMKAVAAGGADVVFIGDSITHYWETNGKPVWEREYPKALNLGFSADRTEHVLWRLEKGGELDGYKAKCIVLMIGTNNAGHFPFEKEPPADTILGVREILRVIMEKQPEAKIVLCSIFPRGADAGDPVRLRNDVVNRELVRFADGKRVFWCETRDRFLTSDGRLSRDVFHDLLHPNALGYEIWHETIAPMIDAILAGAPCRGRHAPVMFQTGQSRFREGEAVFPVSRIRSEGYGDFDWWLDRVLAKRREIVSSDGEFDIVFMGDSITHNWERREKCRELVEGLRKKYSVLNIGYSGDSTQHLLWRAKNGELDGYRAKCIMLLIGTNNFGHNKHATPEGVAAGIKAVLDVVREKQPQAKVLLLPIFPRDEPGSQMREKVEKANSIAREFADGKDVVWVDVYSRFLDKDGKVKWCMPDKLHPNEEAYRTIWLPAVEGYFEEFCGKTAK